MPDVDDHIASTSRQEPHQLSDPAAPPTGVYPGSRTRRDPSRVTRSFIPMLGISNFGIWIALLTPALETVALKVRDVVGPADQAGALSLVAGVGAIFAMLCNPLAGRLSDRTISRFGQRRPWIIGGFMLGIAALAFIALADNVIEILIGWCLAQAGLNAALAAIQATIPDQVPERRRGLASSVAGIAQPVAIFAGAGLVALFTSQLGRFLAPALLGFILCIVFVFLLKDRRVRKENRPPFGVKEFFGSFVFNPKKAPDFAWLWLNRFLIVFGYQGISTYLTYFLLDRFVDTDRAVTHIIVICNLAAAVGTIAASLAAGWLSDRIGRRKMFVTIGGLIMVAGLVTLALAPNIGTVYLAQAIIGAGYGSYLAVDLALATTVLPNPNDRAKDLGVLNIANSVVQSLGPLLAPMIIVLGSGLAIGGYSLWYLFGALVSLSAAFVVFKIKGAN